MKYRKKPLVIDAIQWNGENLYDVLCFLNCEKIHEPENIRLNSKKEIEIYTLEGVMTAQVGDFIIEGVHGEFYPCKPDIFEASYDIVEE